LRLLTIGMLAVAMMATSAPAGAYGTARVQQPDGSVQIYEHVSMVYSDQHLTITSADGKGVLVISKGACSYIGRLQRCFPYEMYLDQNGQHPLDFEHGTVYYNPTGDMLTLPYSTTQIPPKGIICSIKTKAGTYISIHGKLDKDQKS